MSISHASTPKFRFDVTTVAIITGASRGLGKAFAIALAQALEPSNHNVVVLTGRDEPALQCTKASIDDLARKHDVVCIIFDFGISGCCWADLKNTINPILTSRDGNQCPPPFGQVLLIHNAATVGPVSRRSDDFYQTGGDVGEDDVALLSTYIAVNVTAPIILTSNITHAVCPIGPNADSLAGSKSQINVFVVNITSLLAAQPTAGMSLYCSTKAAREMYFRVLAEERNKQANFAVLNYAPGPLDTDMMKQVVNDIYDPDFKATFREMKETLNLVPLDATCKKLLRVLAHGLYTSGDHIDYYDP